MLNFEIKTHRVGITYKKPHFFILNKGLNSGKSLQKPCPNCYVITTQSEADKNILFHLSMMLQLGSFYNFYLKGSVIPFITINDCKKVLINGLNSTNNFDKHLKLIEVVNNEELRLKKVLLKLKQLKKAYVQSFFITENNGKKMYNTTL